MVLVDPFSDSVAFSKQFGTAGNTAYPSVYGHTASAEYSINVGAVPWWAAPPLLDDQPDSERGVQLARAGTSTVRLQRQHAAARTQRETSRRSSRRLMATTRRSSARVSCSTRATRRDERGRLRRRTWTRAEPAELLRYFFRRA